MNSDGLAYYDSERIAELDAGSPSSYQTESNGSPPTIIGVILAAGTSSRFGTENKLLAELDGDPLVTLATRTLLDAALSDVVVVVGHEGDAVRTAVTDLDVRIVENPAYKTGLSTTVERGVEAATEAGADAVIFLPGDMPSVDATTVDRLVDVYKAGLGTALAAAYNGKRGNPVLFDQDHFSALRSITGDVGGRSILEGSDDGALVESGDAGVINDIDTPNDLTQHREPT